MADATCSRGLVVLRSVTLGVNHASCHHWNRFTWRANTQETFGFHPELTLVGAFDRNELNLKKFCNKWAVRQYGSIGELLGRSNGMKNGSESHKSAIPITRLAA